MEKKKFQAYQKKGESKKIDEPSVETSSRRELRKAKRSENNEPKETFWVQIRMIPIWLRLILIILLIAIVAVIGLRVGYSYIGDGNPEDVLKKETWTHIIDIIKGKE